MFINSFRYKLVIGVFMGDNMAYRYQVESGAKKGEENFYRANDGQIYYLKITETKRYTEVFDGMKTFRIYGMNEKDLQSLKDDGQLNAKFSGEVHVLSKTGTEYKTDLGISTFNAYVVMDFQKVENQEILRKMVLAGVPSKLEYKEAEAGKRVYATATYEKQDVYSALKIIMERKGIEIVAREKIPKNKNEKEGVLSEDFEKLYAPEIKAMKEAIDRYAKTGDQEYILLFVNSLLKQLGGSVTPSRETADLMFRYMYELQKAYFKSKGPERNRLEALVFYDPEDKSTWTRDAPQPVEYERIAEATKTNEGRTWLTGILQKWEAGTCLTLNSTGFASYEKQAEALDMIVGKYIYKKGGYRTYQDMYLKARKTGNIADVGIIINPVDYQDVAEKTGGKGWKALGPSTLASYMIAIAVEKPVEEKPAEVPVEKPKTEYAGKVVYLNKKKTTLSQNERGEEFNASLAFYGEKAKGEISLEEFMKEKGIEPKNAVLTYYGIMIIRDLLPGETNKYGYFVANPKRDENGELERNRYGGSAYSAYYDPEKKAFYEVDKGGKVIAGKEPLLTGVKIDYEKDRVIFEGEPWELPEVTRSKLFEVQTKKVSRDPEENRAEFFFPNYGQTDKKGKIGFLEVKGTVKEEDVGEAME
jgi:hypothetical protein